MENNRKCYTCGKEYYYCFSCPDELRPTYLTMFCCEDCVTVFDALCNYGSNKLTAKECNELIKDKIPEEFSNYSEGCQKLIKKMKKELDVQFPQNNKTEKIDTSITKELNANNRNSKTKLSK